MIVQGVMMGVLLEKCDLWIDMWQYWALNFFAATMYVFLYLLCKD